MNISSPLKRKAITSLSTNEVKKPKINSSITSFFTKPKSDVPCKLSSSSINDTSFSEKKTTVVAIEPKNFDKVAWVNTLTGEQKRLLKLEIDTLHESWMKELKDDMLKPSFLDLKRFLQKEKDDGKTIFPPEKDIYSWSRYTPLSEVKAVILGQDPYHNFSQAHGLSFSVKPPTSPPPSLRNIFLALKKDYPTSFRPPPLNTGDLTPWARQGVLMLNTCLTVRAHEANSHANHGWEMFTQSVIDIVAKKRTSGVVFLAWGTPARKRVDRLNKQRHLILLSVHPSPLSAQRGWFECGHFRKTNEWLASRYGGDSEIDWNLDTNFKEMNDKKIEVTGISNKDVFSAASDAAPDEETSHVDIVEKIDESLKDTSKVEASDLVPHEETGHIDIDEKKDESLKDTSKVEASDLVPHEETGHIDIDEKKDE
ncbi:Uracil-DNA glycosylase [Golovinomyces cichoracearum]|uniref:Uracil-DNA glycosylase n=1 Tax=Golovinomyces cichoracearum TaxID=62708 RepID=A0A420HAA9_9PEZI|nr:Uracil-DNA glycosylase [Golovinomyces cichoracearum]